MGVLVRQKALEAGYSVPVVVDPSSDAAEVTERELTSTSAPLDVIIDFTEPGAVIKNIKRYGELKVSAVIGTTGWYEDMKLVEEVVAASGIGLIWSGNFSLGVNLFFRLVEAAGEIIDKFDQYDVLVHEYHHRQKVDSPSGTAQMIGDILIAALGRKNKAVTCRLDRPIEKDELHISSTRCGSNPGIHRVVFDSEIDTITLEHSIRSRAGLADGSLLAARWIHGRSGLYNINNMMQSIIGGVENR